MAIHYSQDPIQMAVRDWQAAQVGEIALDPEIFGCNVRRDILSRVIQWQLDKRRSGNHQTRGISQISGTTRKPWKQKGTGRARAGSLRSPQFRGGAVIFGPLVRDHGYSLQKKVRRLGLKMALSAKVHENRLFVMRDFSSVGSKTRDGIHGLEALKVRSAVLVGGEAFEENVKRAFGNIPYIDLLPCRGLNVYDIMRHDHVILSEEAISHVRERFQ